MYCSDCRFFSDLGRCRNGSTRKSDVGYFQKACAMFEPIEQKPAEIEQNNPKIEHTMEQIEQTKTKHCPKCGRDLPITSFGKKAKAKDGLQSWCKECQNASAVESHKRKRQAAEAPAEEKAPSATITRGNGKTAPTPSSDPEMLRARQAIRTMVSPLLPKQEDLAQLVHFASSQVLIAELAKRGWKGHLTYTTTADLNCEE